MFNFNNTTSKRFRESIKYLDRHSLFKLSHNGNSAYIYQGNGYLVTNSSVIEYTTEATTASVVVLLITLVIDLFTV